jgi:hypothetical protein
MWRDESKKHYFWTGISKDFVELMKELESMEAEEQTDLYVFDMHMRSKGDWKVFNAAETKEIKGFIKILVDDTKRHARTIARIIRVLHSYKKDIETQEKP